MRTCWMQQPSFRQVGDYLREKYEGAAEMIIKLNRRKKERLKPRYPQLKRPTEADLLYYESSPNYCDADASEGSLGTSGRECNISSSGMNGCELLCCGRGHNIQQTKVTRNCNCIFLWCCQVKCQKCKEIVNKYTCKWICLVITDTVVCLRRYEQMMDVVDTIKNEKTRQQFYKKALILCGIYVVNHPVRVSSYFCFSFLSPG